MSGIFCFEGEWSDDLVDKSSVRPLLEFLHNAIEIDFLHRNIGTKEELEFYCRKWVDKNFEKYEIGYFAFHGIKGKLNLGEKTSVSVEDLGQFLEGKCEGKIIYFGSCSVLNMNDKDIYEFKKITKAKGVCGYRSDVDWVESSAFDLLLFYVLSHYDSPSKSVKYLEKTVPELIAKLKFEMY